jgi:hypothetical protein
MVIRRGSLVSVPKVAAPHAEVKRSLVDLAIDDGNHVAARPTEGCVLRSLSPPCPARHNNYVVGSFRASPEMRPKWSIALSPGLEGYRSLGR